MHPLLKPTYSTFMCPKCGVQLQVCRVNVLLHQASEYPQFLLQCFCIHNTHSKDKCTFFRHTFALPANDHSYCSSCDSLSPPSPLMSLLFFSVLLSSVSLSLSPSPSSFLSLCRPVWLLCRVAPWRLGHCSAVVFAHLTFLIAASFSPQPSFLFFPPLPTLSLFYLTPCLSK